MARAKLGREGVKQSRDSRQVSKLEGVKQFRDPRSLADLSGTKVSNPTTMSYVAASGTT